MIRLNVFAQVPVENREKFLLAARELTDFSLKDEGCVAYDIFESATRGDVCMICETWADASALKKHEESGHFMRLVPQLHSLAQMKLERFEF